MPLLLPQLFSKFAPSAKSANDLLAGFEQHLPEYEITTPLRISHFLAQAAHETAGFIYFTELWGPTDAQKRYEGRLDLGNNRKGDGFRYRGRGIFQLTGRANYTLTGKRLSLDLESNPDIASQPGISVLIACDYWRSRECNRHADGDDILRTSIAINGCRRDGLPNGYDSRRQWLARAKRVIFEGQI